MAGIRHTVSVVATPEQVWAVVVDVERWPERIPTVDTVERLDAGPLAVGSRTRMRQPRLPGIAWLLTRATMRRYVRTEAASIKQVAESATW